MFLHKDVHFYKIPLALAGPFQSGQKDRKCDIPHPTLKTQGNDLLYIPTDARNTLLRIRMKAVQRTTGLFYPAQWSKWEHPKQFLLYSKKHHQNDK